MNRSLGAALLMFVLTTPAVHGQARLLPPPDATPPPDGSRSGIVPALPGKARAATLGPPMSVPTGVAPPPAVPLNGPPHQMYGREPAHGTQTAGEPRPPTYPISPPLLPTPLPPPQVCGPCGRFWAELDGLVWWVKGDRPPPLVTTSPPGTAQNQAGVLGVAGTTVLAGGREINDDARGGIRLNIGYWLDPLQTVGIQAGGFWLANNNSSAAYSFNSSAILARPFLNVANGLQDAELVGYPGVSSGSVVVGSHSSFDGWDVAFRENACCCGNGRIDALLGYRQLRLADGLDIAEHATSLGGSSLAGTQLLRMDHFDTANTFYAAEFGVLGEYHYQGWVVEGLAKMDVGWNASHVNINGNTLVTAPGQPGVPYAGGLLGLPSNIGLYHNGEATVVPELGINVAFDFNDHLRVRGGYSFLYWDHVDRPGQAIDTGVNPNQVAPPTGGGPPRPLPTHDETDLVVHGVNFGVEVRY
jgi:Putative beta barrel porin-7 (BBP7)